ncbi:putative heme chaperone [Hirschfeldia incana]|nr:putative heme chaperone [Hirschfeldia incana]
MLRTTASPIFSSFTSKPRTSRLIFKAFNVLLEDTPPSARRNASTNLTTLHQGPPTSAYVHLPFCRKRCHYCDFPILALGSSSASNTLYQEAQEDDPRITNYVNLLVREINATRTCFDTNPELKTVFFGGGTPSLVPPKLVSLVLETLSSRFGLCPDAEVSMEMDPGTFGGEKLKELMELGVNRVSLGVQAFQDELLKACGRAHGVSEVYEAIEIVKSCGVGNWSMDLISSLPHQSLEMWEESLRLAIESQPSHVSVYDLQVEQGTKFGNVYTPGQSPLPSETQSAEFYRTASSMLRAAGYEHYEVSSYSKEGFKCKHNLIYWKNKPFYAFGLGSASYVGGLRFSRPRRLKEYTNYVSDLENGAANWCGDGSVDLKDVATDIIMLSFRTSRGLELKEFGEAFGRKVVNSICKVYEPYVESEHIVCLDDMRREVMSDEFKELVGNDEVKVEDHVRYLRLRDPDGFLLSNELISLAFGVISP